MSFETDALELEEEIATSRREFLGYAIAGATGLGIALGADGEGAKATPPQIETLKPNAITLDDLKSAEKVMGVCYSEENRKQVLNNIEGLRDSMKAIRKISLDNGLPPAPVFNPQLQGNSYRNFTNTLTLETSSTRELPVKDVDIAFANLNDMGHWIKSGQISSAQLTEIYLVRIEKYAEKLECFVTVTADLARQQAKEADDEIAKGNYKGPLHGIPYSLKDLANTAGIRTTWGAEPFKDQIAEDDASLVKILQEAGAVLLGKATSGALAYGDVWFGGITRNPWNVEEGSSGSSAGPSSSTAAGLAAFGIGTETLGSIISPSNRCGLAGLRPSFGRVTRSGFMALSWSLDKVGPICRFTEDTAIIMSVISKFDPKDASSSRVGFAYNGKQKLKDIRVGYIASAFEVEDATDIDRNALKAANELGLNLIEVELPELSVSAMRPIIRAEASAAFEEITTNGLIDTLKYYGDNRRGTQGRVTRFLSAIDYVNMERYRRIVMEKMNTFFNDIDVLISPNYAGGLLTITNYTGTPQLIFRAGFIETPTRTVFGSTPNENGPKHKVPVGFSVYGPLYGEGPMIRVAKAMEEKLGAAQDRPQL